MPTSYGANTSNCTYGYLMRTPSSQVDRVKPEIRVSSEPQATRLRTNTSCAADQDPYGQIGPYALFMDIAGLGFRDGRLLWPLVPENGVQNPSPTASCSVSLRVPSTVPTRVLR